MSFDGTERFAIKRRLGTGGMGVVYEAFDSHLGSPVALKTLTRARGDALLRFKTEFRAVQDLDHPNLVNLGELMEHDGTWFFTMELVSGVDFLTYVYGSEFGWSAHASSIATQSGMRARGAPGPRIAARDKGRPAFDEARLRDALAQLAYGLTALHDADKVHRDVKPSNIMVDREGRVVLLDFGLIAQRDEDDIAGSNSVVGTIAYMSPEQAAGMPAEPASDLYAVGVMLYEVLAGRLPFSGSAADVLRDKQTTLPPAPSEIVDDVPPDLEELCLALLSIGPEQRPTVIQLLGCLNAESRGTLSITTTRTSFGPKLVGRAPELAFLSEAFAATRDGAAVVVLVHGQSGVGKSALIADFASRASNRVEGDVVLLRGRCYERESVPFKGFDGVMDSLAHYLSTLPETETAELVPPSAQVLVQTFPVLSRVNAIAQAPSLPRIIDPVTARARVFSALRELLGRVAERCSVIVTIDDMHWADADSFLLLQELLAPPAPPMLLLLSARKPIDLLPDTPDQARAIELETLPHAAATELARALLEHAGVTDTKEAEAIARETEGHPYYIAELAQHTAASVEPLGALRLHDAIRLRASRLADDAQRVLELVSIAAGPMPLPAVRQAVAIDASSFARHLSTLRVSNLVRCVGATGAQTVEPYHDRVRDSMIEKVPEDTARSHHERLAAALVGAGGARLYPELLLHHLEASGQTVRAADHASEAAQRAVESFAFLRAAELLRIAIRLGDHDADELRALHRRLADALQFAGHGYEAADHYLLAADGADATTSLECHGIATRSLVTLGHLERGVETMRVVLARHGLTLPSSNRGAIASIAWNRLRLTLRGRKWKARDATTIPKDELVHLDALQAVSDALGPVSPILAAELQQRHLLLALRVGEPERVLRAIGLEATFLATKGQRNVAVARLLVEEATDYATQHDVEWQNMPIVLAVPGVLSFLGAEFERSERELEGAERACLERTVYDSLEISTIRLFWLGALRELGAYAKWLKLLPEFLRDAEQRNDLLADTSIRRVSVVARLAAGDRDGAYADLERTAWPTPPGAFHMQHWFELQARAEVALYDRNTVEVSESLLGGFERLRKSMLYYVRPMRYAANWVSARLWLSMASHPDHRRPALRNAARLAKKLRRDAAPHVDVWAQLIEAGIAFQKGNDDRAVELLERAERGADELSLRLCAASARWRRAALIGGDAGEALRVQAIAWQHSEDVVNMDDMAALVTPGFDTHD